MILIIIIFAILLPLSIAYSIWSEKRATRRAIQQLRDSEARTEQVLRNWYTPPGKDEDGSCFHMVGGACQGCTKRYGDKNL